MSRPRYLPIPKDIPSEQHHSPARLRVESDEAFINFTREVHLNGKWQDALPGGSFRVPVEMKASVAFALLSP